MRPGGLCLFCNWMVQSIRAQTENCAAPVFMPQPPGVGPSSCLRADLPFVAMPVQENLRVATLAVRHPVLSPAEETVCKYRVWAVCPGTVFSPTTRRGSSRSRSAQPRASRAVSCLFHFSHFLGLHSPGFSSRESESIELT